MTNFEWMQKHHGCTATQWAKLLASEQICHHWAEEKCNGTIQQDDDQPPHRFSPDRYGTPTADQGPINDEEEWAVRKAQEIAAGLGGLIYHQGDPRCCSLYFYTAEELAKHGESIERCYNRVGTALCGE